jgi:hypothetical protein
MINSDDAGPGAREYMTHGWISRAEAGDNVKKMRIMLGKGFSTSFLRGNSAVSRRLRSYLSRGLLRHTGSDVALGRFPVKVRDVQTRRLAL